MKRKWRGYGLDPRLRRDDGLNVTGRNRCRSASCVSRRHGQNPIGIRKSAGTGGPRAGRTERRHGRCPLWFSARPEQARKGTAPGVGAEASTRPRASSKNSLSRNHGAGNGTAATPRGTDTAAPWAETTPDTPSIRRASAQGALCPLRSPPTRQDEQERHAQREQRFGGVQGPCGSRGPAGGTATTTFAKGDIDVLQRAIGQERWR